MHIGAAVAGTAVVVEVRRAGKLLARSAAVAGEAYVISDAPEVMPAEPVTKTRSPGALGRQSQLAG